jgi:hypothetical protein
MVKDIPLGAIFREGIISALFICFSETGAFYDRQTSVVKEVIGKGQSVPRGKEVKSYKNYT